MRKQLLIMAALFMGVMAAAQSNKVNLVVFSEDGDAFYAYVNGIRQNDKPETNVKVTGVTPNISLRLVFENKAYAEIKQNMSLEPGFEHTARVKRDVKKGGVKLRYFGQTALSDEPAPGVTTIAYHTQENPAPAGTQVTQDVNTVGGTTVTSTTTQQTTDNVSMNVNMGGVGINMNVTTNDPNQKAVLNTTTSTTVTSSHSSTGTRPAPAAQESKTEVAATTGCSTPMTPSSFSSMRKSIEDKPFSDTKMSTARVATKNACLSTAQVKEICKLFSMDDDKLAYAKFAYDHCVDKANYYQVSEVFSFSSTTEEFNSFLEK